MMNKYSLTFPQKNIWLVENFFGKSAINTIVGKFEVNKEFDYEICAKAINKMLEVNEGLRLQIGTNGDEVYQYVKEYTKYDVEYFDMSNKSKEELTELEERLKLIPFEVVNSPLYYIAVLKTGADKGYIFVKLHHLVSDAWTFGNVATSLSEYIDLYSGKEVKQREIPSYTEYIESEKEYVASEKFGKDKEFWKEYLGGITETIGLKETSNGSEIDGKRYTVKLDNKLNDSIKEYCKENRLSPYTIFMTALAIYMHRVTEKTDFVIGTPVLGRSNFKEKQMMGMFVGTMPVRFKIDEEKTFLDMCKETAKESMSLFRHQKYPYSLMLEDFRKENNIKSNLYEVMISYQNARAEYSDNEKYSSNWLFSEKVQDQFAIHIMDMDETGTLEVHFDYLTSLFEDIEIKYIAKRLFTIIEDGIVNNKKVSEIEIMPEEEKNKILYEFNNTKTDYPKDKTVIDLFEEQVEKTPDKVALVFENKEMTYSELNERANALAELLNARQIGLKDNIGIMQDKSFDVVITILAILKLGAIYVPIDNNATLISKRHIIKNANIKCIISNVDRANIDNTEVINMNKLCEKKEFNISERKATAVINIMYTSGTTGMPKGVKITNKNIIKLVKNSNYINFDEKDKMLQTGTYTFDASTLELWNGLLNGVELHIVKKELQAPKEFGEYIKSNKITVIFLTTAIFNQMIEYDATMFNGVRLIMTGGETMSREHANKLLKSCPNVVLENLYGPTENTVVSTYYPVNSYDKIIPIGKPISNTTCYILDSKKRLLPINVKGILYVGGDGVSEGYVNNQEMTNDKFVKIDGDSNLSYNTGDIAEFSNDGNILFFGRKDSEIKIKGIRVELDEIKTKVNSYNDIVNSEVLCLKDKNGNKYLGVVFVSDKLENIVELKKYLKSFLPSSVIPRKFVQIEKMPLTLNHKIDKKKLVECLDNVEVDIKKRTNYEGVYLKLYKLFSEVLEISDIVEDDDFFELGGDSILGVNLITKAVRENINITYNDLYKYRTIKELGDMLNYGKELNKYSTTNINDYDYSKIDKLLKEGITPRTSCNNIILTGGTGFLGIHILADFIDNKKGIAYCLIRKSNKASAKQRLRERLAYYFGSKFEEYIDKRIIVVEYEGNLSNEVLENLKVEKVTHFINSLALVKHYGEYKEFYMANVYSVELICDFCIKNDVELLQISTLSVSGDIVETAQSIEQTNIVKKIYTENNLYMGQDLENLYAYTKFIAERNILEKVADRKLKARIFRMGNLSDRISDGKFQINESENAFSSRLKSLISIGVVPENTKQQSIDLTPVDSAANIIVDLLEINEKQIIYHLFNNNKVNISEIVRVLKQMEVNIEFASNEIVSTAIHNVISNNNTDYLKGLMVDISNESDLKYVTDINVINDITVKILRKYRIHWPEITEQYLKKVLRRIIDYKGE